MFSVFEGMFRLLRNCWICSRWRTRSARVASMFASLNSQFIFLFLTTGIISEIGVADLTQSGLYIDSRTFRTFEVFLVLTGLYILISMLFKTALAVIERVLFPWKFVR
mgnify:CR=1 FL=1